MRRIMNLVRRVAGFCLSATLLSAAERPNVLIVINDDQSWRECSAYGNSSIATPAFDRLAKGGVLFTHGYCSAPSCAPARAALLTGRNFWELEQGAFIQAWLPAKFATLPERLAAAGYHAGYTGKGWGPGVKEPTGKRPDPAGKAWSAARVKNPEEGINPVDYAANFAQFLDARPAGQPFYFWAGLTEPHHPHGKDNHVKLGVPLEKMIVPGFLPDTPEVRRELADYQYEVRHADGTLDAFLRLLEERGLASNTLVIATADNGTPVLRAKTNIYDWGVRVPLAMRWPAGIPAGRTVTDFATFADLAPTILDLAGITVPGELTGRSLRSVVCSTASGRVDPTRDFAVNGIEWHGNLPPADIAARMIREDRYLLIVNYSDTPRFSLDAKWRRPDADYEKHAATLSPLSLIQAHPEHPAVKKFTALCVSPRPPEELYDCDADPDQLVNLADRPELADVKKRLRERLEAYQRKTNDPRVTGGMEVFAETMKFVQGRKSDGYGASPTKTKPRAARKEKP